MNIGTSISKGIKEGKWISITYEQIGGNTSFWIAVLDIVDFENKVIKVSMFNDNKGLKTIVTTIYFDKILSAQVIDFSSYDVSDSLFEKIENNLYRLEWLNYDKFNHNVLNYYNECNLLDNDPFIKEYTMIPGIDRKKLRKEKKCFLNEEQVKILLKKIYHFDINNEDMSKYDLAISCISIDNDNKKYIMCYYDLFFDPYKLTLKVGKQLKFNKSFLIENKKHSLFNYINSNVDDFINDFKENYLEKSEIIKSNLRPGEIFNDRPEIFILEREFSVDLTQTFKTIEQQYSNNELNVPLKSFFGNISRRNIVRRKEPSIIIYDDRININQMRVVYNSLKFPVTYVQGPPGTGKTQTILNVILSCFFESKTVLVCSSNNKPVDGIIEKLQFKYNNESVLFPFLRLGKFSDVIEATKKIKQLFEFKTNKVVKENLIEKIKVNTDENNLELLKLLKIQEDRVEIEEYISSVKRCLDDLQNSDSAVSENIRERMKQLQERLKSLPVVTNEQIVKLFTPLIDNKALQQYLFFKSLGYIQKLKEPKYKHLINICYIEDDEERAIQFNKWLQDNNNMKLLNNVFPIIFSTNISSNRLGSSSYLFDLVIMDEAGQCNVAHALIPIVRAKSLLLVGDPNQLKPVIVLENSINNKLMEKYHVSEDYSYKDNSILDVMVEHDNISRYILLKYHYRCGKKIIRFSNDRYYNSQLNLNFLKNEGELEFINIKNKNILNKNEAYEEAKGIVDYIVRNKVKDVAIVTPFVNQQVLINKMLVENGIDNVKCGTIHSLQGAEKETVILSTAISPKTSKLTYNWIKDNFELINVAVTRAKNKLVIVSDLEQIENRSNKTDDLYNLVKYVAENGNTTVPPNESVKIEIGKSNGSKYEDEFYKTISQFCSVHSSFEVDRNVSIDKLFVKNNFLKGKGFEFDCVLYEKKWPSFIKTPKIAIEVNGGEHFGNNQREYNDSLKRKFCKENNISLLVIPNSFVKSYEYITELIIKSKDKKVVQLSLFDD